MINETEFRGNAIGQIYDEQADPYSDFAPTSYSWEHIEKPAFDKYIPDLMKPNTQVLDLGCGEGRIIRYLIAKGVNPQNITGVDVSSELIKKAQDHNPDVKFISGTLPEIPLTPNSFDLITSNMVFHYMGNEELEETLEAIYKLLKPGGQLFFVDTDPDHSDEGMDPENINKWLEQQTPWGTSIPYFNRHPRDLFDLLDLHGFDYVSGWPLKVSSEGTIDPEKFERYSSRPSRMAARLVKVDPEIKNLRMSGQTIPSLT